MKFLSRHWLIITILALAAFVRLYHLPATMTFLEDEGRDLLIAHRMIDTGRPVLLGPQTSTGNMYLGPLYYYLITPALFLSGGNPLGPTILIALSGVVTTYLMYFLGRLMLGNWSGYLAAVMYGVLPLAVTFTRNSWNPNLAPLVSLLMIYLTYLLISGHKQTNKIFFGLGILAGALLQLHYMALLFLVGIGLTLLIFCRTQLLMLFKGIFPTLLGLILIFLPFIVFEIRNDFVNTHAITRFIEAKEEPNIRYRLPLSLWSQKVSLTSTRLLSSLFGRDALTPDPYRVPISLTITLIILGTLVVSLFRRRSEDRPFLFLASLTLIPLSLIGIYQENIHLHYLGFFFPLIYLLVAGTNRYLSLLLVGISLIYSTPQLISYLRSPGTNQVIRAQQVAEYIVQQAGDRSYNVVSAEGTPTTPYLYFLAISSHPPTTDMGETLYLICQDHPCSQESINSPFLLITGQAHPTISAYLGHPLSNYYERERISLSNEHVSHGAWVAEIMLK